MKKHKFIITAMLLFVFAMILSSCCMFGGKTIQSNMHMETTPPAETTQNNLTESESTKPNESIHVHTFVNGLCDCGVEIFEGLEYTPASDGTYYCVTGVTTYSVTDIVIPSTYKSKPIKTIGDRAFADKSIKSIVIPNSVTAIGREAFYNCQNLLSITIPNSVTNIGDFAFALCYNLMNISIPNSVISIGSNAFSHCKITTITIPNSVTSIGEGVFSFCTHLTNIQVDENNIQYQSKDGDLYTKDGGELIHYATGKTDTSFEISNNVTSIYGSAFAGCKYLTSVIISDSVKNIGVGAFQFCERLEAVIIPNSITSIGMGAFNYCKNLIIYCEAESQPSGWDIMWNYCGVEHKNGTYYCPIFWGHKG